MSALALPLFPRRRSQSNAKERQSIPIRGDNWCTFEAAITRMGGLSRVLGGKGRQSVPLPYIGWIGVQRITTESALC